MHGCLRHYLLLRISCRLRTSELRISAIPRLEKFRMRVPRVLLAILVFVAVGFSQSSSGGKSGSGFSIDNIDKNVDPCVDFYQYACGNWMKKADIPADRASWQSFSELDENNLAIERGILEKAAAGGAG